MGINKLNYLNKKKYFLNFIKPDENHVFVKVPGAVDIKAQNVVQTKFSWKKCSSVSVNIANATTNRVQDTPKKTGNY